MYYEIFNFIFKNVLRRFKNYNNYIYVEQNNKISMERLKDNLSEEKSLPKFKIEKRYKDEIILSMPDYVLGIFTDCIKKDFSEKIKKLKDGQTLLEE